MSVQNSNVVTVLALSGNAAALSVGKRPDELAVGQAGVFDYHTGLSIDASLAATGSNRAIYIAMGIDTEGGSTLNGIVKSPIIYKDRVTGYTMRCYTKPQDKIVEVSDICADCETDYTLKILVRTPSDFHVLGAQRNPFIYTYRTACCGCNADCPTGDCSEWAIGFYNLINDDPRGIFTAKLFAKADAGNLSATEISAEDAAAAVAADPTDCPVLRIYGSTEAYKDFCVETKQLAPMYLDFEVVTTGFNCCGSVDTLQELSFGEGVGLALKMMESWASGYGEAGPYRQGATGAFYDRPLYASKSGKYDQIVIEAEKNEPKGGFDRGNNPIQIIIGVPYADTTTGGGILDILDPLFAKNGFDALKNDFTDCPDTDSVNHSNEGFDGGSFDSAKDGLA